MRSFVRTPLRCAAVAAVSMALLAPVAAQADAGPAGAADRIAGVDLDRVTIVGLQQAMERHRLTSEQLTGLYLDRIRRLNPRLGAVVAVNPDAAAIARASDRARRVHGARGPLEGIPVLLKENMDTADRQPTTAGSTALSGAKPAKDAELVRRLREAGAVVLGKANMTEWANFRSPMAVAGWSAVGGQTHNPYVLDRSASGSSSGSAAAAAASLAAVTIGTDTGGSIVDPAATTSTVGVRPTLGLVSRSGIVPITSRQDTAGPIARNVTDAALTLWAIQGPDPADPDTAPAAGTLPADYRAVLDRGALRGKRIGVWREGHTGISPDADRVFDATVRRLKQLGATVVEGADVPQPEKLHEHLLPALMTEFKHDVNAYLAATPGSHPADLAGLIAYNEEHADIEDMARFGQEYFELAEQTDGNVDDPQYRAHRAAAVDLARRAIDDTLAVHKLDAIVTPTTLPATPVDFQPDAPSPFASTTDNSVVAGYPQITVPAGYTDQGLPLGVSFLGTRFSDARLLGYAYAFEQASHARHAPNYLPTLP
ncbi:amidase [Streptomyces sp. BE303]|uniref:amidase n=1 Tax=Streptomyces sp. BE303 TaxID=3002528 RepID=UPI002E79E42F|nr:amidase [Streptomyces sp. BE303]MED7951855.1 amidase [Streptomyces sp. BE303]